MFAGAGQPTLLLGCGPVCERGAREGTILLASLFAGFQPLLLLPTSKLGPSGADIGAEGVVYILRPRGSLQQTLL